MLNISQIFYPNYVIRFAQSFFTDPIFSQPVTATNKPLHTVNEKVSNSKPALCALRQTFHHDFYWLSFKRAGLIQNRLIVRLLIVKLLDGQIDGWSLVRLTDCWKARYTAGQNIKSKDYQMVIYSDAQIMELSGHYIVRLSNGVIVELSECHYLGRLSWCQISSFFEIKLYFNLH